MDRCGVDTSQNHHAQINAEHLDGKFCIICALIACSKDSDQQEGKQLSRPVLAARAHIVTHYGNAAGRQSNGYGNSDLEKLLPPFDD